jgi:hypothetical protein
MVDFWELLDRASNVENLTERLIIYSVLIYTNRDKLKWIGVKLKDTKPPEVEVQMKPANVRAHALRLQAQSKSGESPTTLEELLAWYLRIASS